ncbi:MAG: restriction endonuclease subunit S [Bacteroidota bacterium]|nr:restriction endonuclease subunit S [Bacteroidota bacterium]
MSSKEWKTYKLRDLTTKIGSGATPRGGKDAYLESGDYSLIRSQNVLDFTFSYNGLAFINKAQATQLNNVTVAERDVLLNITGDSVARVCQVPNEVLPARVNQHVAIIRPDNSKLLPEFLKYYLLNPSCKNQLLSFSAVGATRNALTKGMIEDIDIQLPIIKEQQRIASILSSLDDKIELNRQTNQTLEGIAQTLFQEMCVPRGEELPEGWRVGKLEEVLEIKYGKDHKHLENGLIPVYGSGGIMRYANKALYEHESILIPRKGTLSNLFYINKPFWSVDTMFYTKIKNKTYGKFLFLLLKTMNLATMNVGSAVPSLTTQVLNNIEIILPSDATIEKFDDIVTPMFTTIESNEQETQTLIALRDSLLPKLMKGEIEI